MTILSSPRATASSPVQAPEKARLRQPYPHCRVIVLDDESPQGLARCIERSIALSAEERAVLGRRARAAVEGVTWRTEVEKILAFIQSLKAPPPATR